MPEIDGIELPPVENFRVENDDLQTDRNRNYLRWLSGIAAILLIIAAIYFHRFYTAAPAEINQINSLAVLPFTVVGEETVNDKLGLGMADAVITRLSKLQTITVRPTSAVFRYTDRPAENSADAGRDLGVDSVLEGTVQSDKKTVRVSVRLIKVADGKTLWAENFNEKFSDIFSVQDLISSRLAETLSLKLSSRQEQLLSERNTSSTEAFEAFQLGNYFWNRRSKEDLEKSIEYFQTAIKFDPNYALAHGALADSYAMFGYYGFADQNEMSEKTLAAAEKALSLNSESPEPYLALGAVDIFKKNFKAAQTKIERAVALAPYNSSARHRYGVVLLFNGNLNESVAQMRLAQEYDPLSPVINKTLCGSLIFSENYSEAVGYCEIAVRISPETPGSRTLLANAYFLNKRYDEALDQMHLAAQNKDEAANISSTLAYYYSKMGRRAEAERIYAELKNDFVKQPELAVDLTLIGYALGKKEEALKYYEQMLKQNNLFTDFEIVFAYDPMWNEIKNDPNFDKIYRQSVALRQN
jgi:TolB-like protein/Flp pilus assembly protein TadD